VLCVFEVIELFEDHENVNLRERNESSTHPRANSAYLAGSIHAGILLPNEGHFRKRLRTAEIERLITSIFKTVFFS